ncbi:MAG: hypothetical protein ACR2NY_02365 [Alphaproteobacteria bacterium]
MTKIFSEHFSLSSVVYGLVAWALAFLAGIIYMKIMRIPNKTAALSDNRLHAIGFLALVVAVIVFYLILSHAGDFGIFTANSFFVVNLVMDLLVLIWLMKFNFMKWLIVGLPCYGLIFYGLYFLLR